MIVENAPTSWDIWVSGISISLYPTGQRRNSGHRKRYYWHKRFQPTRLPISGSGSWGKFIIHNPRRLVQIEIPNKSAIKSPNGDPGNGDRQLEAREAYNSAFETLQSLRGELAASNPDTQLSFQQNIETIYREYIDLLLTDNTEPSQPDLKMARDVIAALQAVEIENFLRQGCPENNLAAIDKIIDSQAGEKTAAFSPIVLASADGKTVRVEVILKLPDPTHTTQNPALNQQKQNAGKPEKATNPAASAAGSLKHYRTVIDRQEFTSTIRDLQYDLEEEYTFRSVKQKAHKVYQWLLAEAEQRGDLNGIDTLVFALDTRLRNIPLAALVYDPTLDTPDRQGYLIEKYAVAIAPRLKLQDAERFPAKALKVLAVGLSEKPKVKFQGRLANRSFPALPYVKQELQILESMDHKKLAVSSLLDPQFTARGSNKHSTPRRSTSCTWPPTVNSAPDPKAHLFCLRMSR